MNPEKPAMPGSKTPDAMNNAFSGIQQYNAKMLEYAQSNIATAVTFAQRLATVVPFRICISF